MDKDLGKVVEAGSEQAELVDMVELAKILICILIP